MVLDTVRRYLTLKTHNIHTLPIAILMPHSGCNCRCVMCDIWQGDGTQELNMADIRELLDSFRQLHTRWVVMSGGEALMNPNLFEFCRLLRAEGLKISILSTGLLLTRYARQIVNDTDEVIVSLDGSEPVHDAIRRIPNAYRKLRDGVHAVKSLRADYRITGRCVIQRLNFSDWPNIVKAARDIGLDQISFLPADVSSEAFNRPKAWDTPKTESVKLSPEELPQLKVVIESLIAAYPAEFAGGYIAESPSKIRRIYDYYAALNGQADFPPVRCNAPWVSAVVEGDGAVRPCFFHPIMGNIRDASLAEMLNSREAVSFRKNLDMASNPICSRCVCTLNLRPTARLPL